MIRRRNLIAATKGMHSSTVQLLITCQLKADARSENNRRLQVREGRGEGGEERREVEREREGKRGGSSQ